MLKLADGRVRGGLFVCTAWRIGSFKLAATFRGNNALDSDDPLYRTTALVPYILPGLSPERTPVPRVTNDKVRERPSQITVMQSYFCRLANEAGCKNPRNRLASFGKKLREDGEQEH
jgi:hypothetical protein